MLLNNLFTAYRILFHLLFAAGNGIFFFGRADLLVAGAIHGWPRLIPGRGDQVAGTPNVRHFGNIFPAVQAPGNFYRLFFSHPVGDQIRL